LRRERCGETSGARACTVNELRPMLLKDTGAAPRADTNMLGAKACLVVTSIRECIYTGTYLHHVFVECTIHKCIHICVHIHIHRQKIICLSSLPCSHDPHKHNCHSVSPKRKRAESNMVSFAMLASEPTAQHSHQSICRGRVCGATPSL